MSIQPGALFGPYEIAGPLGAGGMGEVYRARDSRLNRDVALKILPPNFAADPDRRARFEREAQAIASLSHPNILAIFDTGIHDGQLFIVTELLEGETLREHDGRLPVRRAIEIGVQIARGLTAAHDKGLVHRDLKPENIFLLADGQVKILDFGLARQTSLASAAATGVTAAPTAAGVTDPGMAVGTAGYMSPEQVRGAEVDHRTDIFAFGSVLYEMLSGRRAFQRETAAETMTAILKEDPPELVESGLHISPQLDRIVRRCLEKQPRMRFQSASDLGFALDAATVPTGSSVVVTAVPEAAPSQRSFSWIALPAFVLGFILAAVVFIALHSAHARPDSSGFHFTPFSFEAGGQDNAVWSPDGKAVAYAASMDRLKPEQVFVRYLDSPTGKQLTYFSDGTEALPVRWTPDGRRILFTSEHAPAGLWSVAVVGGEPKPELALDTDKVRFKTVDVTNDGSAAAMLRDDDEWGLWISSPLGSPARKYSPDPFATRSLLNRPTLAFSPDQKHILLFINSGDRGHEEAWLMPYPADPSHPPRRIFQDFPTFAGTPNFSWMPDSRRIVIALRTDPGSAIQLFLADTSSGRRAAIISQTSHTLSPNVSPDGSRLIFSEPSGSLDIVSVSLDTAAAKSWMATERDELMPAWALNQPLLAYVTDRNGPPEIWLHSSDGVSRPIITGRDFPMGTTDGFMDPILSPAGDRVIYSHIGHSPAESSYVRIWISSVSGGDPVPVTNDATSDDIAGAWSPDGNSLVYMRVQNGKVDIMKVKTSGQDSPVLLKADINPTNSSVPIWSPAGDWIEYNDKGENLISPDGKTTRSLGNLHADGCTFDRSGRMLYCLRFESDHETLFSVDLAGGAKGAAIEGEAQARQRAAGVKVIGKLDAEFKPASGYEPSIRLSLSPDGKSIVYGQARSAVNNLWMLEGLAPKEGLLQRLHLRD
ncbi:MAG TPA: protein kinase [Terriglobia bacterium]|jgi:serine/threonine protein kinase